MKYIIMMKLYKTVYETTYETIYNYETVYETVYETHSSDLEINYVLRVQFVAHSTQLTLFHELF